MKDELRVIFYVIMFNPSMPVRADYNPTNWETIISENTI